MTASVGRLQNSAIFSRRSAVSACSLRHSRMSGWMPISRSSLTECWVGLVFISPAALMNGTSVYRLEERQRLDVAHRAADLDDRHVGLGGERQAHDAALDLVGDVRDDLDRAPQVVAAPLLGEDRVVDLARGHVVAAGHRDTGEALVVAQVEVGLGTVVGDEHLAVLERAHGPGIDVEVGIELLDRDAQATRLEQQAQRGRRDPLAQRRHHPARHHHQLGHGSGPSLRGQRRGPRRSSAASCSGVSIPAEA